jgi:hypothetical protein
MFLLHGFSCALQSVSDGLIAAGEPLKLLDAQIKGGENGVGAVGDKTLDSCFISII